MKYTALQFEPYMQIESGQDGAIYNNFLFRFDHAGFCNVYTLSQKETYAQFTLDRIDAFCPHSNAVFFGTEKYDESDEFPLLYTNLYNTYSKESDRREGICCVYRLTRNEASFSSKLVQLIRIGFVENRALWKSMEESKDVRPYGNFTFDPLSGKLYAFVMRDKEHITRYFAFDMPKCTDGTYDETLAIHVVTLREEDIRSHFDASYSNYIQGACCMDGMLISTEGFNYTSPAEKNPPRIQIIDLATEKQIGDIPLYDFGLTYEPEFIYPSDDHLYYADCRGNVYTITFH